MRVFAIRFKLANVPTVQRPHDADARKHHRPAKRRDQDQGFHRRLPFLGLVLGFRQLRNIIARILESDELATARQRDRIVEGPLPTGILPDDQRRIPSA